LGSNERHCYHSTLRGHNCLDVWDKRDCDNFVDIRCLRDCKCWARSHKSRKEARIRLVKTKDTYLEWSHLSFVWRVLYILEKDFEFVLNELWRTCWS
jgi:hypothetical protein